MREYDAPHTVCHIVSTAQYKTLMEPDLFERLRLELRRGSLILAVLVQLQQEHYGYTLRKALADHGLDIDEGTLYPLLRRLESQGLLTSQWREEDKRNKRYYRLAEQARPVLSALLDEWKTIDSALARIQHEARAHTG